MVGVVVVVVILVIVVFFVILVLELPLADEAVVLVVGVVLCVPPEMYDVLYIRYYILSLASSFAPTCNDP